MVFKHLEVKSVKLNLKCLEKCFENDKDEFIDTQKFEAVLNPIVNLYDAINIEKVQDYAQFIEENVSPCILKLFEVVKEDFKWKRLNYLVLLKTRTDNYKIKLAIMKTITTVLEILGERYIVLVNDLLPFISEMLDDLNPEVERMSKQIVIKLEQVSGENIREYFKMKM